MPSSLAFPGNLSITALCKFSLDIHLTCPAEHLVIATGSERFISPTAMVFLAKSCRTRVRRRCDGKVSFTGLSNHQYANNLGFSEALRIQGRPHRQGAFGGSNYIPMSVMSRDVLETDAAEEGDEIGDAIQRRCDNIARIISQDRGMELRSTVSRSFREIFRNVFEHAEASSAYFCAQYWPTRSTVEICIADRGIGFSSSINTSRHHHANSDLEALYLSLMPGVSSKAWRHKKKRANQKSHWDNSGFGLFFAHQLFGKLGHFFIGSGQSGLLLTSRGYRDLNCHIEGSLISMGLDLSNQAEIDRTLEMIGQRAFALKERLGVKSLDYASVAAFLQSDSRTNF